MYRLAIVLLITFLWSWISLANVVHTVDRTMILKECNKPIDNLLSCSQGERCIFTSRIDGTHRMLSIKAEGKKNGKCQVTLMAFAKPQTCEFNSLQIREIQKYFKKISNTWGYKLTYTECSKDNMDCHILIDDNKFLDILKLAITHGQCKQVAIPQDILDLRENFRKKSTL